jgi:hypothetical protein
MASYSLTNNCYRRHNYYDYIGPGGRTSRRIVVDAVNEQERTGSEGGCHDVRRARLTTLDGRLKLVVFGFVVIVVASIDGE